MATTFSKKIRNPKLAFTPVLIADPKTMKSRLDGIALKEYEREGRFFRNFSDWVVDMSQIKNPDHARCSLYSGFQPLYDAILEERVPADSRFDAVTTLDLIMQESIRYYTSYYLGKPATHGVSALAAVIAPRIKILDSAAVLYCSKERNIGNNGIYPEHILLFLRNFAMFYQNKKTPEAIVACACGSSEIAMALAGLLGVPLIFMRRSHRRGDDEPRIVKEHTPALKALKGLDVLCLEDYVCSGGSLARVMARTKKYGASNITGASVNRNSENRAVKLIHSETKFHLFGILKGKQA